MKVTVVGMGYVGLSNALMLAIKHDVTILDIDKTKVENFNNKILPIHEDIFDDFFCKQSLHIEATYEDINAYMYADYVIIALPTNFNDKINAIETDILDNVIFKIIKYNKRVRIIIKSTVPIGYTEYIKNKTNFNNIFFCPEFLREDKALTDCLNPSRIVVGGDNQNIISDLFKNCCKIKNDNIISVSNSEAEAIKLFSNTFLAMRVAFFNEIDSYALKNSLNSKNIIDGICKDSRIGDFYNNPSFGYGGYCLPKDTLQTSSQVGNCSHIIQSINKSNKQRIKEIAEYINKKNFNTIGIYKLEMKKNSSNFRNSSIVKIIKLLKCKNILIYEPLVKTSPLKQTTICNSLEDFILKSDIILANRNSEYLQDVKTKVFSRDIYNRD